MNNIPNQVRKAEVLIALNLAKDVKGNNKSFYRYFCDISECQLAKMLALSRRKWET